ncbi:MAG: hypothetical protein IJ766_00845 [Clostridia bacterium]|nr:hypothetical protein [Clostridia bacterium]
MNGRRYEKNIKNGMSIRKTQMLFFLITLLLFNIVTGIFFSYFQPIISPQIECAALDELSGEPSAMGKVFADANIACYQSLQSCTFTAVPASYGRQIIRVADAGRLRASFAAAYSLPKSNKNESGLLTIDHFCLVEKGKKLYLVARYINRSYELNVTVRRNEQSSVFKNALSGKPNSYYYYAVFEVDGDVIAEHVNATYPVIKMSYNTQYADLIHEHLAGILAVYALILISLFLSEVWLFAKRAT